MKATLFSIITMIGPSSQSGMAVSQVATEFQDLETCRTALVVLSSQGQGKKTSDSFDITYEDKGTNGTTTVLIRHRGACVWSGLPEQRQ